MDTVKAVLQIRPADLLLPCKKCSHSPGRVIIYGHPHTPLTFSYRISCPKCSYCTKEKETINEAIAAWNQRG